MRIDRINNVNNTLNSQISFKSGVQTNYGIQAPSPKDNIVEGGLLTGFVGTIMPFFSQTKQRAQSIEEKMSQTKLNLIA